MVGPAQDNQTDPSVEPAASSSPGYVSLTAQQTETANEMSPGQAYEPQPQVQPQPPQPPEPPAQQPLTPPNQGFSGSYRQQRVQPPSPQAGQQTVPPNQHQTDPAGTVDPNASYDPYDPYYDDYLPLGPQQEELVYEWRAPSRPFKQHNRQYYTTVGTIVLLLVLILFFAGQILTIAVVLAAAFLTYIMSSIPPHTVLNQITTYGIRTSDNLYYWDELGRFWFKEKHQDKILHVEVARFPERLTILVGEAEEDIIRQVLSLALLEQEPAPTYYEKAAAWMQEKIPLDIDG